MKRQVRPKRRAARSIHRACALLCSSALASAALADDARPEPGGAAAVTERPADHHELAARPPERGWQPIARGPHHEVATLHTPGAVWVRVRGHVDAGLEATCRVLADVERYDEWFPGLTESDVLRVDPERPLIYGRIAAPWPMRDRDYLSRQRWRRSEGGFELETLAVSEEGALGARALPTDTVRLRRMLTLWQLRPAGDGTRVEYLVREPGARDWIQDLLVKRTAALSPTLLENLRAASQAPAKGAIGDVCAAASSRASRT